MADTLNNRPATARGNDPLAELARIVNRDNPAREEPFVDLFNAARQDQRTPAQKQERDVDFDFSPEPIGAAPVQDDDAYYGDEDGDEGRRAQAWSDEIYDEDAPYEEEAPPRRRSSGVAGLAMVAGLAVVAAGAGYAWYSGGLTGLGIPRLAGEAPLISASKDPTKIEPAKPAGLAETAQSGAEKVVAREEQPIALGADQPAVAATPRVILPAPNAVDTPRPAGPSEASAAAAPIEPAPTAQPAREEPRRVRTVKVLADGTIVTGDAPAVATEVPSLAGQVADAAVAAPAAGTPSEPIPGVVPTEPVDIAAAASDTGSGQTPVVETPVAEVPAADSAASAVADLVETKINDQVAAATQAVAPAVPAADTAADPASASRGLDDLLAESTGATPVVDVAMPPPRPEIPVRVAALEPAAPADPEPVATASVATQPITLPASDAAPAAAAKGGFVVQIAAAKSAGEADSTLRAAQRRFAVLLEGQPTSIKRVEIDGKGTFYRVRVGPLDTRDAAISLCTSLKSAGGDCVVAKN